MHVQPTRLHDGLDADRVHPAAGHLGAQEAVMDWGAFLAGLAVGLLLGGSLGILAVGLGLAAKGDRIIGR